MEPGAAPVVLLNYRFWKKVFHEDRGVVGTSIILNGQAHMVIGVMPPRFQLFAAAPRRNVRIRSVIAVGQVALSM